MSSSNKRHSILPSVDKGGPKAPASLSGSAVISENAIIQGTHSITVQSETVVHHRAKLESIVGSIFVGRRCILHERTHIGAAPSDAEPGEASGGVIIADHVTIEVAAVVEAGGTEIGAGTVVGIGSRIGTGAKIGKFCTITPLSIIAPGDVVPDNTVIYSNGTKREDKRGLWETKMKAQSRQIEQLRRMIPSNPGKFL